MGDRPNLVESRLHGASGTSTTVGNTRSCTACSTGLTHAVRLTNRQGATNPRRPLAPNLPVLRFEPNPPALTLSTHGCEVIAREAIPAMTDVLVEFIHTHAVKRHPAPFESGGIATVPAIGSRNFSPQD